MRKNHSYFAVISFDLICLPILPKVTSITSECPATGDFFIPIHRSLGYLQTLPAFIVLSTAFAHKWYYVDICCDSVKHQRLSSFALFMFGPNDCCAFGTDLHIFGGSGLA